jgi:hypothetical protein
MRMRFAVFALAGLTLVASAHASPQSESRSTSGATIAGLWTLDLASMAIPPDLRPTSVTVEFAENGAGLWKTTYVITAKDGGVRRMTSSEKFDGRAVSIEGDQMEADSVAVTNPVPGVLVMGLAKEGRPGSVRVYTVSANGREMTESAANVGDDGKPVIRTFRWTR